MEREEASGASAAPISSRPPDGRSGRLLILGILAVALAAALYAWSHQYQRGQRVLAHWGAPAARLIRQAPRVELMRLSTAAAPPPHPLDSDPVWRRDISQARGLVHARQALIEDASYRWEAADESVTLDSPPPRWSWALSFHDDGRELVLLLDLDGGYIRPSEAAATLRLNEKIHQGLSQFFAEQEGATQP